ncbi:hypothetical protein [Streptomyces inhibens]|uniref:hypothetical protein n=1 Tax=Streptomyces inhibens TaxID=2293571 RepID=UPI001EE70878|nr:hypothetical protein [Streptomyces inhibens]UKY47419.1 hypothetical protein KI385_00160 [Streptomyces inhibens]
MLFLDRYAEALELAGTAVQGFVVPESAPGICRVGVFGGGWGVFGGALAWCEVMVELVGAGVFAGPGAWCVYGWLVSEVERLLADLVHADVW